MTTLSVILLVSCGVLFLVAAHALYLLHQLRIRFKHIDRCYRFRLHVAVNYPSLYTSLPPMRDMRTSDKPLTMRAYFPALYNDV